MDILYKIYYKIFNEKPFINEFVKTKYYIRLHLNLT
ncbi:unknown [Prevotella sp. CAG:1185]|nr:unknown [Prevotella sp. CAG:1185]